MDYGKSVMSKNQLIYKESQMKKILFLTIMLHGCSVHAMLLRTHQLLRQVAAHELVGGVGSTRSMGSLGIHLSKDTFALPTDQDWSARARVLDHLAKNYDERYAIQREASERVISYALAKKTPSWFALNALAYDWSEGQLSYFISKCYVGISADRLSSGTITPQEKAAFDAFRNQTKLCIESYAQLIIKQDMCGFIKAMQNMNK